MAKREILQLSIVIGHTDSEYTCIIYATAIHIILCNVFFREYIGNITDSTSTYLLTISTLVQSHICAKTFIGEGGRLKRPYYII
jgi:hypothetical protein